MAFRGYHQAMAGRLKRAFDGLAAVIGVVGYFWPSLTVSVLVGALLATWGSALVWIQKPAVYVPALAFLFVLWVFVGLAILWNRKHPQSVRIAHEYAYSLIPEATQAMLAQVGPHHEPAVALVFNFRNVGAGPLRLRVEDLRVVIDARTNDDIPPNLEVTLARMGSKGIRTIVRRTPGMGVYEGTATLKLLYGPPDVKPVRRYILKVKVNINSDEAPPAAHYSDEIVEEKDTPYSGE
jgi:hypothetical protein